MRTPTDAEFAEFLTIQDQLKSLTKRLEELKELFKARGTCATKLFACVVTDQTQSRLAGLDDVAKVFGKETLERYNLIKTHTFQVVKVSPLVQYKEAK